MADLDRADVDRAADDLTDVDLADVDDLGPDGAGGRSAGLRAAAATGPVRLVELAVAVVVFLAAAVSLVYIQVEPGSAACARTNLLVPRCGTLWGVATDPNTVGAVQSVEQRARTRFDLVYHFHDLDDHVPTAAERTLVAQGRVLHLTIAPTLFATKKLVTWRAITSGAYDRQLAAQARGVASLHQPVFLTFDHESDRPDRSVRGTPADFVAAWRHVHDLYVRAGAGNAVWVWVVTGYPPFFARAGSIWPGNRYVDWIGWESYNGSGCTNDKITTNAYRSFAAQARPFYQWVHRSGPRYGIDVGKPMMISEAGSYLYPDRPKLTADWYAGVPKALTQFPQIKAVTLWDRPGNGSCAYRFDHAPQVLTSVGRATS